MDRDQALAWAQSARTARAELREGLSSGRLDLAAVLEAAHVDDLVGAVTLRYALESLPGARKIDTRRRVAALGVDDSVPLSSLDHAVASQVLEAFSVEAVGR